MNTTLLFLGNLSMGELTVIFLIVLLLFGGNKIPELMRGLGSGIKEFKKASTLDSEDGKETEKDKEKTEDKK